MFAANCGGDFIISSEGITYLADYNYTGGNIYTVPWDVPVEGTIGDEVYRSERYGSFSYDIPLSNGTYTVVMKFAEIYFSDRDERIFDVSIENKDAVTDLDIAALVGKNSAYDVYYVVDVNDGALNINFNTGAKDVPKVSAILVYNDNGVEAEIQSILDNWENFPERKMGQMIMAWGKYASKEQVRDNYIGAVFNGGSWAPPAGNTPESWANYIDDYQEKAMENNIPIVYAMDAVHGMCPLIGATVFPHNIGLGCSGNQWLVEKAQRITATEAASCGVRWNFAPCVAVSRDDRWGRVYESFGETPFMNNKMSIASIKGFQQGHYLNNSYSLAGCTKHYVGDGGTDWQTGTNDPDMPYGRMIDRGIASYTEQDLRNIFLPPYKHAVEQNLAAVMVSLSSWENLSTGTQEYCIQSKTLLTDILKDELNFKGVVVSDWRGATWPDCNFSQIAHNGNGYTKENVKAAVEAGLDMFMEPSYWSTVLTKLQEVLDEDPNFEEYITESARRVLRLKYRLGLFDNPYCDRSRQELIGSNANRRVARQCVRESMVLLKNNGALPLSKNSKVALVGKWAYDIGYQVGGWSIDWLGTLGNFNYPGGKSILGAFENTIDPSNVHYYKDGTGISDEDVIVVVIGEETYAEWKGDNEVPAVSQAHEDLVALCASYGKPVVCILLSGRPVLIGENTNDGVLGDCDAFVAAWLPGTEGQGITDVLFGDYNPTGRLTFSWPRNETQINNRINVGDQNYDPLFEYGYGLDYYSSQAGGLDPWETGVYYPVGAQVTYNGANWECVFAHTSQTDWYPGAPELWFWQEL